MWIEFLKGGSVMKRLLVVFALAFFVLSAASAFAAKVPTAFDKAQPEGTMAKCPVMGGTVKITKDTPYSVYKDKYYYFCCADCKPKFDADPEKYVKPPKKKIVNETTNLPVDFDGPQPEGTVARCPVTLQSIKIAKDTPSSVFEERYYYFASADAKAKFDDMPTKYVPGKSKLKWRNP